MITIDRNLRNRKSEVLNYFRDRAGESLTLVRSKFADSQPKQRASAINVSLNSTKNSLMTTLLQVADRERWTQREKLESILLVTYCHIVVMIESRNSVCPYNFMDFSRRVGELWDPFCQLCFYYPLNDVALFVPPLFSEAKQILSDEIVTYINQLNVTEEQKAELITYYDKVWGLVTSGEVQLELDLHFVLNSQKYNVDFKSGFGSNEKGNMNRLLLVASIFSILSDDYKCLLLVRAEDNNSYFNTLRNSGLWEAYCGSEAYAKIREYSGFDLKSWIDTNINWSEDFDTHTTSHLERNNLLQYLIW